VTLGGGTLLAQPMNNAHMMLQPSQTPLLLHSPWTLASGSFVCPDLRERCTHATSLRCMSGIFSGGAWQHGAAAAERRHPHGRRGGPEHRRLLRVGSEELQTAAASIAFAGQLRF
jgi:hypothetical protein